MTGFEYKVVPAPMRGLKGKGIKGTPARFANAVQTVMNEMGAQGWEYQRTDTLPAEERQGLTGKTTTFQNLLVFRRPIDIQTEDMAGVAALIEDQSESVEDIAAEPVVQEPDVDESVAEASQKEAAPESEAPDANADEPKAALTLDREDRVSETLKAPFTFPWDKRRNGPAETKDDNQVAGE